MTKQEIANLIKYIRAYRQNAYVFQEDDQQAITIMAWHRRLGEFSLDSALEAVESFFSIPENRRGSNPPMPDDIRDHIMMASNPELSVNLDESFTKVRRKILSIGNGDHMIGGRLVGVTELLRHELNEIEWDAVQMIGGHERFRYIPDDQVGFLRNDYKRTMQELLNQARSGRFEARYGEQPSLDELSKSALKAEAQGFDTAKIQQFIKGFRK